MHGPRLRKITDKKNDRHGRNHLALVLSSFSLWLFARLPTFALLCLLLFFWIQSPFPLSVSVSHCLFLSHLVYFVSDSGSHANSFWLFVFVSHIVSCLCRFLSCSFLPSICSPSPPHFVSLSVSVTLSSCSVTPKPQHSHNSKHLWDKSCGLNNGFRLPRDKITHSPPPLHIKTLSVTHTNTHTHTQAIYT